MSTIDDLELSVRASNVLKKMGVETMDDFMALTRQSVMRQKNAGRRTWQEVSEIQTHFRHETLKSADHAKNATATDDFRDRAALVALEAFLSNDTLRSATVKVAEKDGVPTVVGLARAAFDIADAMCAARTKVEGETE